MINNNLSELKMSCGISVGGCCSCIDGLGASTLPLVHARDEHVRVRIPRVESKNLDANRYALKNSNFREKFSF